MSGDYKNRRFSIPEVFRKWIDRYDIQGEMIQDLVQRNPSVIYTESFALDTAQTAASPKLIEGAGRGFVCYFYNTGDAKKTRRNDGFIEVRPNTMLSSSAFPAKHGRGYRGDIAKLFLNWPAQAGMSVDIIVFKFDDDPWEVDGGCCMTPTTVNTAFTYSAGFLVGGVAGPLVDSVWTRVVGDVLEVRGMATNTNNAASAAFIILPSTFTIDSAKMTTTANSQIVGEWDRIILAAVATDLYDSNFAGPLFYDGALTDRLFFAQKTISAGFQKANVSGFQANGDGFSFKFSVPIKQSLL